MDITSITHSRSKLTQTPYYLYITQPLDLKAQLKPSKTVKREIEASQLESVNLKEIPEKEKAEQDVDKASPTEIEPPETLPPMPEVPKEEKPKKKKKKAKPAAAAPKESEVEEAKQSRAEEKELLSPEVEESPLPLEVTIAQKRNSPSYTPETTENL